MAPKAANKRAAQESRNGPAKKQKVNPMIEAICDAIDFAELPESCRLMLKAIIPDSFGIASDQRHAIQAKAVESVGQVLDGIKAQMEAAIAEEVAKVEGADNAKAELEAKVTEAKERLTQISEDVVAKKAISTEVSRNVVEKRTTLAAAKEAQQNGDVLIAKAKTDKEAFEGAIKDHVEPLLNSEIDGAAATGHYKALQPFIAKLTVEESLISPLPGICSKASADRGPFDTMVLKQLEKSILDQFAQLETTIAQETPAAADRDAAVTAAQEAHNVAVKEQHQAVTEWNTAQAAQKEAEAVVQAAEVNVLNNEPEYKKVTAVRDEKIQALKAFETWNYECYQVCRDKVTPVPEAEKVAPVAEAEAPQVAEAGA